MSLDKITPFHASGTASIGTKSEIKQSVKTEKPETPKEASDTVDIGGKDQKTDENGPAKKQWTVLAYLNGKDGNLQKLAPGTLRELEAAGTDDNLNIAAQLSRQKNFIDRFTKDWSGTRRYEVTRNTNPPTMQEEMMNMFIPPYTKNIISPVVQDLGENVNMGDPATLSEFLKWGIEKYPAHHYAVIIYGQGGGFAGSVADADHKSVISNKELAGVLADAAKQAGQKIDLVAFDGNLMSQLEVADQMKDSVKVMVAPESTVSMSSLPMDGIMKDLKFQLADTGKVTPEELAKFFVFEQKYQPGPSAEMMAPTLSAIDLDKIGGVKSAFNELASELSRAVGIKPELKEALREVISNTQAFVPKDGAEPYRDYRDIGHFTKLILSDDRFTNYNFPDMKPKGENLLKAIGASLIDEAHIGKAMANATGISAYMPTDMGFDLPPTFFKPANWDPAHGYGETTVSADTGWDELLKNIAKDTKFHERLRSMGMGDDVINKVDKILAGGKKAAKTALGFASKAGYYESYQAMKGKPPASYFKIPGTIAAGIGVPGGAWSSYQGAAQAVNAIKDDELKNRGMAIFDGVADSISGAAVTAACIGMSFAEAAAIATPAGYVSVAVPIGKAVFDMYKQFKQQASAKQESEILRMSPKEKLAMLDADKLKAQSEQSDTYISPIVRWLTEAKSSGPIDPKLFAEG
ncbi:MAG: clostripain-related cysteine peptidase [Firmicutes bacterium]|nr:clostripain-related cysteine peptidase [Bacillota bacterium]